MTPDGGKWRQMFYVEHSDRPAGAYVIAADNNSRPRAPLIRSFPCQQRTTNHTTR